MIKTHGPHIERKADGTMVNFDMENLARGAKEGLKKAEKLGASPARPRRGFSRA